MKKWLPVFVIVAIAGAIAYYALSENGKDEAPELKTATARIGDLRLTVASVGVVKPHVEVEVKSKAGGEIVSFAFEEGDVLEKSAVVVRLDPETEKSRVNQAEATRLIAEARLEKAHISLKEKELHLKRQRSLYEDKVVSRQALDDADIALQKAGADIKIAQAELIRAGETLKEAMDRLTDTEIRAPLTGTILGKLVQKGQVIASTMSSASEGTLLFTMADLDKIYVGATVDETDIGRITPGQAVSITVDAYPGIAFSGHVVRVAPKGRVQSTITVFDVTVQVAREGKKKLKPMMTANVEVLTEHAKGVLLVPAEAVRQKNDVTGVYKVKADGKPGWVQVKAGRTDGIVIEVTGDLKDGDEVVVSGMKMIKGGKRGKGSSRNLRRGFRLFKKK